VNILYRKKLLKSTTASFLAVLLSVLLLIPLSMATCSDPLLEDLNGDGIVDIYDVLILADRYGMRIHVMRELGLGTNLDLVPDGKIDVFDVVQVIARLGATVCPPELNSVVRVNIETLNLRSHGRWVNAFISPPDGYVVNDVNASTIRLNGTISPDVVLVQSETIEGCGGLLVRFKRQDVIDLILSEQQQTRFNQVTLTITGTLIDGTEFQGSSNVKTIMPSAPHQTHAAMMHTAPM
jgi:hypothetical protein